MPCLLLESQTSRPRVLVPAFAPADAWRSPRDKSGSKAVLQIRAGKTLNAAIAFATAVLLDCCESRRLLYCCSRLGTGTYPNDRARWIGILAGKQGESFLRRRGIVKLACPNCHTTLEMSPVCPL